MMWDGSGMGVWNSVFGALIVVGVIILIVVAARWASRSSASRPAEPSSNSLPDDAGRILDERYAKGDLTTEEYRERKTALGREAR